MSWRIVAALCSAALALVAALSFAIAQKDAGPATQQVNASIKDLMDALVDPSADVLWTASGTVIDKDEGTIERLPKTPDDWADLRHAAVRIIEGANLLMLPGRAAAPPGTKSEVPGVELEPEQIAALINRNRTGFDSFATALRDLGWEALRATEAKNTDALLDIGGRMEEACEGCHQTFWYPNASAPKSGAQ